MSQTYDPGAVVFAFRGIPLTGYAPGTFINVQRAVDGVALVVGADGESTRVKSRNRSGTITLTLRAESPSNDVLTAAYRADELGLPTGRGPVTLTDLSGTSQASARDAWIQKLPAMGFSDGSSTREWIFATGDLDMQPGGNI